MILDSDMTVRAQVTGNSPTSLKRELNADPCAVVRHGAVCALRTRSLAGVITHTKKKEKMILLIHRWQVV